MRPGRRPGSGLRQQPIPSRFIVYPSSSNWLFGISGDWNYTSPSSHFPAPDVRVGHTCCLSSTTLFVCPALPQELFSFWVGFWSELSEGRPLPSGVGGVSSKAAAPIFVPSIAVPSRPPRSFWISQIYRSSVPSLSLSRPHLANDEAHALSHGYACSESTSASLRPKWVY